MYTVLSIAAALVALVVTGFAVFAAYALRPGAEGRDRFVVALRRWTAFDYVIFAVFLIGTLFLLADVIGVMRDRDAYPMHHYGYLLSGFIYNLLAGVFLFVRLGLTFRLLGEEDAAAGAARSETAAASDGSATTANDDERKPDEAQAAEERV
ncbi:hypothetical protein MO973_11895 [Paenibacillus sp. TRM 82003]|nr:hypothetical protein [Paenibacillus sp. TRM 82003]